MSADNNAVNISTVYDRTTGFFDAPQFINNSDSQNAFNVETTKFLCEEYWNANLFKQTMIQQFQYTNDTTDEQIEQCCKILIVNEIQKKIIGWQINESKLQRCIMVMAIQLDTIVNKYKNELNASPATEVKRGGAIGGTRSNISILLTLIVFWLISVVGLIDAKATFVGPSGDMHVSLSKLQNTGSNIRSDKFFNLENPEDYSSLVKLFTHDISEISKPQNQRLQDKMLYRSVDKSTLTKTNMEQIMTILGRFDGMSAELLHKQINYLLPKINEEVEKTYFNLEKMCNAIVDQSDINFITAYERYAAFDTNIDVQKIMESDEFLDKISDETVSQNAQIEQKYEDDIEVLSAKINVLEEVVPDPVTYIVNTASNWLYNPMRSFTAKPQEKISTQSNPEEVVASNHPEKIITQITQPKPEYIDGLYTQLEKITGEKQNEIKIIEPAIKNNMINELRIAIQDKQDFENAKKTFFNTFCAESFGLPPQFIYDNGTFSIMYHVNTISEFNILLDNIITSVINYGLEDKLDNVQRSIFERAKFMRKYDDKLLHMIYKIFNPSIDIQPEQVEQFLNNVLSQWTNFQNQLQFGLDHLYPISEKLSFDKIERDRQIFATKQREGRATNVETVLNTVLREETTQANKDLLHADVSAIITPFTTVITTGTDALIDTTVHIGVSIADGSGTIAFSAINNLWMPVLAGCSLVMLGYVTCICGSSCAYYGKSRMNRWTIESDTRNKIDATATDAIVPVFTTKISRFSPPNPREQEININHYYINEFKRSALSVVDREIVEYNAAVDDAHASNFNQQMQYRRGGKNQKRTKKNKRRKTKNLKKRRKTTKCNYSRGKKRYTKRH